MRIFVSAGEPSGDLHGANLVRALRRRLPAAEFVGFGGPKMSGEGVRLIYPLVDLAVMWFLRVLLNLPTFLRLLRDAERSFRNERPDVVVLIDYPGFHWLLAKRAKRQGIPVVYFVPPQIWAWAGWRVEKVRRHIDEVLCSLPFEVEWYRQRGVEHATYVGHPYFDEMAGREVDPGFLEVELEAGTPIVAILPGSRSQEIERNFPTMIRAAVELSRRRPDARFLVACLNDRHLRRVSAILEEADVSGLPIRAVAGKTAEVIRLADCAWSVSGSVSLELLSEAEPTVILYRVRRIDLLIARPFIQSRYITLVNLLADAEVMPEYLTCRDVSDELCRRAQAWLDHPGEIAKTRAALMALRDRFALPGATDRAAERIAGRLRPEPGIYRGPHAPSRAESESIAAPPPVPESQKIGA